MASPGDDGPPDHAHAANEGDFAGSRREPDLDRLIKRQGAPNLQRRKHHFGGGWRTRPSAGTSPSLERRPSSSASTAGTGRRSRSPERPVRSRWPGEGAVPKVQTDSPGLSPAITWTCPVAAPRVTRTFQRTAPAPPLSRERPPGRPPSARHSRHRHSGSPRRQSRGAELQVEKTAHPLPPGFGSSMRTLPVRVAADTWGSM